VDLFARTDDCDGIICLGYQFGHFTEVCVVPARILGIP
jgi:hypothetical protein